MPAGSATVRRAPTQFAWGRLEELSAEAARPLWSSGQAVVTGDLHDLVVEAQDQEGGGPLADEQGVVVLAHQLEGEGAEDGSAGQPEEGVGREARGVFLDRPGESAFAVFDGV